MKESDIRPQALFDEYLAIAKKDAIDFFSDAKRMRVPCPACAGVTTKFAFAKLGFAYVECSDCGTLFVNPRPEASAFDRYYQDSPSVRFWASDFYRQTAEARRRAIFEPRAKLVVDLAADYLDGRTIGCVIDIGAGYGIFCEEAAKLVNGETAVIAIEPAASLSEVCRSKGINVLPVFLNQVSPGALPSNGARVAVSFELIEHLHDPLAFFTDCGRILNAGDIFIATTLNGQGFDIAVLREHSKSVFPPAHINFFNPNAITRLFDRAGFEVLKVETPGKLDVEIAAKQKEVITDKFVREILDADNQVKEEFQNFLQAAKLSSHMMVAARRR